MPIDPFAHHTPAPTHARCAICLFAKPPRPGRVKTRLCPPLSQTQAATLAEAFLLDTWASLERLVWADPILASAGPMIGTVRLGTTWYQGQGDLGARMERVLRRALNDYPMAMAVGADSPGLPQRHLETAYEALHEVDAVLGPSDDGGFYLLGLRRCPPDLLAELPWSQEDTRARTQQRLTQHHLPPTLIEPWFDVDRPEDLTRLLAWLRRGIEPAPHTLNLLEAWAAEGLVF